jgi:hypothetical protein
MRYFCPFCRKYHEDDNLAIGLDANNVIFKDHAQDLTDEKTSSVSKALEYTQVIIERAENLDVGFMCARPTSVVGKKFAYKQSVTASDIIETLKRAWSTITRTRKVNPDIIDSAMVPEIDAFIEDLKPTDYKELKEDIEMDIYANQDASGKWILHEAKTIAGAFLPKVCGTCHQPTSEFAGEYEEIIIGLLGTERVAKSSCIASVLYGFSSGNSPANDIRFAYVPSSSKESRWHKTVLEPLLNRYVNGWAVAKSPVTTPGSSFCITVKAEMPNLGPKRESILLTFIDMPGELLNDPAGLSDKWYEEYEELFASVDAIWVCIDLVQLYQIEAIEYLNYMGYGHKESIADVYGESVSLKHVVDPEHLEYNLDRIKNVVFSQKGFPPAAIILTKSDGALKSKIWSDAEVPTHIFTDGIAAFEGEEQFYNDRTHQLLLDKFCNLSRKVRMTLYNVGRTRNSSTVASDFIDTLEKFFCDKSFFSTSAYSRKADGRPTDVNEEEKSPKGSPRPFRARLPLYWTLAALGKLDISAVTHEIRGGFRKTVVSKDVSVRRNATLLEEDGKTKIHVRDALCMTAERASK